MEAEAQFGEWHEYVLSPSDVLQIKLPWNKEFQIPETGMTVAEALQLEEVVKWTAPAYPESHVLLSVRPVIGAVEYQKMTCFDGRLIHMDGIHRLLAWAKSGKPEVKAFVAGNYRLVRRTLD